MGPRITWPEDVPRPLCPPNPQKRSRSTGHRRPFPQVNAVLWAWLDLTSALILIRVLPKACFPRIAAVACANDVPLETVGDR
jgi:hypothetical protein